MTVYDGSYHDVDSNELSFRLAGRLAFKDAMTRARPTILEPIMNVEVYAPSDFAGDLMGDLNSRRGRIAGMDTRGAATVINATVPMAEMLTYEQTLTSHTGGRGVVSHGVLALRRGARAPARQDHRGVEGGARRGEGRGGVTRVLRDRRLCRPCWPCHWPCASAVASPAQDRAPSPPQPSFAEFLDRSPRPKRARGHQRQATLDRALAGLEPEASRRRPRPRAARSRPRASTRTSPSA